MILISESWFQHVFSCFEVSCCQVILRQYIHQLPTMNSRHDQVCPMSWLHGLNPLSFPAFSGISMAPGRKQRKLPERCFVQRPVGGVSVHFDAKVGPAIECRLIKVCSISGYVCCIVQSQTMLKWHLYAKWWMIHLDPLPCLQHLFTLGPLVSRKRMRKAHIFYIHMLTES